MLLDEREWRGPALRNKAADPSAPAPDFPEPLPSATLIDEGVYPRNRLFRLLLSSKHAPAAAAAAAPAAQPQPQPQPQAFAIPITVGGEPLRVLSLADLPMFLVGLVVSFFSAWLCIRWLLRYISSHSFSPFAWYRIALGALLLVFVR